MSYCFGLYFGSTNLCLAMHKDGKTEILANAAGDRVTPSVVAFLNGERSVGLAAKQGLYRNPNNTICNVKELLDVENGCYEEKFSKNTCKVIEKNGLKYEIENNGKFLYYSPIQIVIALFSTMKEIACRHSHDEDTYPTVITVPLRFNREQRKSIRKAATEAGFEVLRMVSEPSAALLAYGIGQDRRESTLHCVVFRMGDSSVDVTLYGVFNGLYSVLSSIRKDDLGGRLLTELLVDVCSSEFQRQYKVDIRESKRSAMKLRNASENCKHVLSTLGSAQCFAESVYDGIDLSINVGRARFESRVHGTLQQCIEPIDTVLSMAGLSASDISKIILAGGSCKIPKLQQLISEKFSSAELLFSISPDEVIAVGAAIEAACVSENGYLDEEECHIELLSEDIYIKVTGIEASPLSSLLSTKGSIVPVVQHRDFNLKENDSNISLEVFEGDIAHSEDEIKKPIAALNVSNLPVGQICFSFHIRSDGSMLVICKDNSNRELGSAVIHTSHIQDFT